MPQLLPVGDANSLRNGSVEGGAHPRASTSNTCKQLGSSGCELCCGECAEVRVKVLRVDSAAGKLSLSLKASATGGSEGGGGADNGNASDDDSSASQDLDDIIAERYEVPSFNPMSETGLFLTSELGKMSFLQ